MSNAEKASPFTLKKNARWIKATTPPDSNRLVLICPGVHRQVSIGRYENRCWWDVATYSETGGDRVGTMRYWMPLPKAPKGAPLSDETEWEVNVPSMNQMLFKGRF